jgi:hypothetical protein
VKGSGQPEIAGIFTGTGPTEQNFVARNVFLMGKILPDGNDAFRAQNG